VEQVQVVEQLVPQVLTDKQALLAQLAFPAIQVQPEQRA
jgi:hypothetical protein